MQLSAAFALISSIFLISYKIACVSLLNIDTIFSAVDE